MSFLGSLSSAIVGLIAAYFLHPILDRKMKCHTEIANVRKDK